MFVIVEVGQAHEGSLAMALSYVRAAASVGAHAVKFQMHIAEAESSSFEPFRVPMTIQDATRYDYWKRMEFSLSEWSCIREECRTLGLEFIVSPFSIAAVKLLKLLDVDRVKIASGETTNALLIDMLCTLRYPMIVSSGLSTFAELDEVVTKLRSLSVEFSILQCTTAYPVEPEALGLNCIDEIRRRYRCSVGLSDHSGKIFAGLGASCFGADLLEVHVVFSKSMMGPDVSSSLTFEELALLIEGDKYLTRVLNSPVDKSVANFDRGAKNNFGKSLAINLDLKAGEIIKKEYLESKKPAGMGIPASDYESVIGKVLKIDKKKWDFLAASDVSSNSLG